MTSRWTWLSRRTRRGGPQAGSDPDDWTVAAGAGAGDDLTAFTRVDIYTGGGILTYTPGSAGATWDATGIAIDDAALEGQHTTGYVLYYSNGAIGPNGFDPETGFTGFDMPGA